MHEALLQKKNELSLQFFWQNHLTRVVNIRGIVDPRICLDTFDFDHFDTFLQHFEELIFSKLLDASKFRLPLQMTQTVTLCDIK